MEYTGAIPNDANCGKAIMQQEPIILSQPESPSARAVCRIADRLLNIETGDEGKGIAQLFNRWMKSIYKKKKK